MSLSVALLMSAAISTTDAELLQFSTPWCSACREMEAVVMRLKADGYPVRHIDASRHPQLAQQFRITSVPSFIMVHSGREVDRIVGATSYKRLVRMFPQRQPEDASALPITRGQTPGRGGVKRVTDALTAIPRMITKGHEEEQTPETAPAIPRIPNEMRSAATGPKPDASAAAAFREQALRATVRLRVDDPRGNSYGTGTVIDVHQQEALVLTCAHIFRPSQGRGRIMVDTFDGPQNRPVEGKLISHDQDRDVALVSVRPPSHIEPVKIASASQRFEPGQPVFSIGCDRGGTPEVMDGRIVAVNRYLGPPNLVVKGQPVDGRSGGGLFDSRGRLIAVCNAADPTAGEGVYAAAGAIHQQLDETGLGFIYRNETSMPEQQPLVAETVSTAAPPSQQSERGRGARRPPRIGDDTEIICIVRARDGSQLPSQVFVLDRPSAEFVGNLQREVEKDRLAEVRAEVAAKTMRGQSR